MGGISLIISSVGGRNKTAHIFSHRKRPRRNRGTISPKTTLFKFTRKEDKKMAVFRIEKTRDYTVMSNHHLKDRTLTLKSKGLLSMKLSLPEEWNYTTRGLASICREGVDSIGSALKELELQGYIKRSQLRDEKSKTTDTEYVIYETPQVDFQPDPDTETPDMDKPDTAEPCTANPAQLNKNISSKDKAKKIYQVLRYQILSA